MNDIVIVKICELISFEIRNRSALWFFPVSTWLRGSTSAQQYVSICNEDWDPVERVIHQVRNKWMSKQRGRIKSSFLPIDDSNARMIYVLVCERDMKEKLEALSPKHDHLFIWFITINSCIIRTCIGRSVIPWCVFSYEGWSLSPCRHSTNEDRS